MAGASCTLVPLVKGKPSQLYKDLLEKINNTPLVNYIYAHYLQLGVAALMINQGLDKLDALGQHSAEDVYKFFEVGEMTLEQTDLLRAKINSGAVDSNYNIILYTSAVDALNKAIRFNKTNKGWVASVTPRGGYFEIQVHMKDSRSLTIPARMEEAMKVWDQLSIFFRSNSMNLADLDFAGTLVNPLRVTGFIEMLRNSRGTRRDLIPREHYLIFLEMSKNTPEVRRLVAKYGSIEDAALKIWEFYRGITNFSQGDLLLIEGAVTESFKYNGLDLNALELELARVSSEYEANSEEINIEQTLKELNNKYGIDNRGIHLSLNKEIKTLSQAVARMSFTLERYMREIRRLEGNSAEALRFNKIIDNLLNDLKGAKFGRGALLFMLEAAKLINSIDSILKGIKTSGTNLEVAISTAKVVTQCFSIINSVDDILQAMLDIDSLILDGNISDSDKAILKSLATQLQEIIRSKKRLLDDLKVLAIRDTAIHTFGNNPSNGINIANLISMQEVEGSSLDFLYSIGTVSDPLVAAWGNIIRDAEDKRSKKLNDISLRIRRATHALYKSGYNSEFMYDKDGRIISDIDWDAYFKAKKHAKEVLESQGLTGIDLEEAMAKWVEWNTMEREVDKDAQRYERVPDTLFRKEFKLEGALKEYYETMMQIKGELGTLLPNVALLHYIPPQIRRSTIDALKAAKNAKDVFKAIWHKVLNIWKIREDDTNFTINSIIEGEEYNVTQGNFEDNPIRRIPIYYMNKLEDPGELLKDFSGAMQQFAGMALTYDAMIEIKDLIELMGDYLKVDRRPPAKKDGTKRADMIRNRAFTITQTLAKKMGASSELLDIVDGMIDWHIYGKRYKNEASFWSRATRFMVNYTSIKGLALNIKGAIANFNVGELLMMIEAAGGEFYNPVDYLWAHKMLFGGPKEMGRIMGIMTNDRNSKEYLLSELFDPENNNFQRMASARYHKSMFRQLLGGDFTFLGYSSGEYLLHYINMYAMLHNLKVIVDGKKMNLYEAFTVGNKVEGNSELMLKGNHVTDEQGNIIDEAWLMDFRKKIRYVNQSTHGAMNEEDKGIFHRTLMGKLIMNFRLWMVGHYSRRYRKEHWDANLGRNVEGFWRTYLRMNLGWLQGLGLFRSKAALHWKDMTNHLKANVRRAIAEQVIWALLVVLSNALGEPKDHKREFWYRMLMWQVKRLELEMHGSTPTGAMIEAKKLINAPMPSLSTINGFLYPFYGISDFNKKVERGPHKGENRYIHNCLKYSVPFYKDIWGIMEFDEDDSAFQIFNTKSYH